MKKLTSVRFVTSAVTPDQYPNQTLPEIAFIGRSNVGKSSLLNTLVKKKNLAHISNTPGRTQLINFFNINEQLCFVDLPGYGYAKVPEHIKKQWQPMIETYLTQRENLRSVILIVDARHTPTRHDRMMRQWLQAYQIPMILIATKIDKIPKTRQTQQIKTVRETLQIQPDEQVLPFSALKRQGVKPLWRAIFQAIAVSDEARKHNQNP
ncbi:YihA family ribosome biogenesis GTP-binding protein [candidate division KSB3 bacterium]|uniref:Probable GTP-binding protein EngB n=1 Tax=candidate division KSB3 bacterium TaxID=2044937 RepID=A0A9D5JVB6_9BACT|nr:YihA family ribosome biogenesis GTP-binding protein [candidate division KSB3 bacterium]MBD3324591.1 YihA family ribosome biogenesis GTP-binding protein [candidate division KSB3 bacterium]